jgi:hypothetical protein
VNPRVQQLHDDGRALFISGLSRLPSPEQNESQYCEGDECYDAMFLHAFPFRGL